MEGIREEIRKETSLGIFDTRNITDQTKRRSISHGTYHSIQTYGLKLIHKRLHADPVIAKEHHSFFSILMHDIHKLFCKLRNFSSLECGKIHEFLGRNPVRVIHVPLINDKFRTELITYFLFKLLQNIRTYRCRITIPVYIFLSCQLVKDQCELMEKCRETNHIHIRMALQEFSQTFLGVFFCLRLTDIKCDLFFHTLPVISHRIIHMNRIPHNISQKTYRIIMKSLRRFDGHITGLLTVTPLCHRNHFSCRTVDNFPPSLDIIMRIYL